MISQTFCTDCGMELESADAPHNYQDCLEYKVAQLEAELEALQKLDEIGAAGLAVENVRLEAELERWKDIANKEHARSAHVAMRNGELEAENELLEKLLIYHGHLPSCPQFTGPYDLGELEPSCNCGHDALEAGDDDG